MRDEQQQYDRHYMLPTFIMIALETVFSFILQHDHVVRLHCQKFVQNNTTVRINSYIPPFDFYVQFTAKGILFDTNPPAQIDLVVQSGLLDLIKIIVLGSRRSVKSMRIKGDNILRDEFKDLIIHFSLPQLLSDWKQWFNQPEHDADVIASKKRLVPLLEKIDQQRSKINELQVEVKQYKNRLRHLEQKQLYIHLSYAILTIFLLSLLVYSWWLK